MPQKSKECNYGSKHLIGFTSNIYGIYNQLLITYFNIYELYNQYLSCLGIPLFLQYHPAHHDNLLHLLHQGGILCIMFCLMVAA